MNPLSLIPPGLQLWVRIAALLALAIAGIAAGVKVTEWRLSGDLQALRAEHAQTVADAATAAAAAQKKAQADHDALAAQLAGLAATYHEDLMREQGANDLLRADLAAGRRVVRVAAACPDRVAGVPQAAGGGVVDPGAGAVLAPETGQAVLDLRADAIRVGAKLAACQAALGCITGQRPCQNPSKE